MISDSTSPLSKIIFYMKGFILIVISLTINNITLNQGIRTTRVTLNGNSNGPYILDEPVNFWFSPSLLSSDQTLSPSQLSTIETSQFFLSNRQKANPSYDNLGESIAKKILHSFHLIDDDSEISTKQNNNVRRKKAKLRDNQSPNEAIAVYRNGEDQGTRVILKESIKSENESPSIDGSSGYILQDDTENENGGLTDDEEILSILEQNAKNRKKQKKLQKDEDENSADDGDGASVKEKPGRYVIKKIFKGKNGELTAIDWIEDRGHDKQDTYHKEEYEDTQQKRNVVKKKVRKSPSKSEKKDETNDDDEDQSSDKKSKKEKKKRKSKKKKKSNKQKKQHEDDDKKEAKETTIDGEHIPQLLWSYLSRKNGKDSLPIEQIKISKV